MTAAIPSASVKTLSVIATFLSHVIFGSTVTVTSAAEDLLAAVPCHPEALIQAEPDSPNPCFIAGPHLLMYLAIGTSQLASPDSSVI